MSKSLLLMSCIVIGLLVLACNRQDTNRNAAAPATASSPATTHANANTATASAEKVGVAECDNFITAYESCVSSKVPESARGPLRAAVHTWRTDWKRMAENPQSRAGLAAACTRQLEAARTQLKAYNCTF
jgi:hypothetical protein